MEPFGLLQFLQTLLKSPPMGENAPSQSSPSDGNPTLQQKEDMGQKKENTAQNTDGFSPAQEACLDFMQAHEKRKGRIGK